MNKNGGNMILTKKELKEWLKYEHDRYFPKRPMNGFFIADRIVGESYIQVWKFQKILRITEYHYNNRRNVFHLLMYFFCAAKKNRLGIKLGLTIPCNVFDKGLVIDHYGSVIVNGHCRIGKNCRLHGNNCVGNKGVGKEQEYPIIGDNLDLGTGACVIGNVRLGNSIVIGANAVVTKAFEGDKLILIGTPARIRR